MGDDSGTLLVQEIKKINLNIEKLVRPMNQLSRDMEILVLHSKLQVLRQQPDKEKKLVTQESSTPAVNEKTQDKDLVNIVEEISLANYGDFDFVWQGGSFAFAMFTLHVLPGRKGSLEPKTQVPNIPLIFTLILIFLGSDQLHC